MGGVCSSWRRKLQSWDASISEWQANRLAVWLAEHIPTHDVCHRLHLIFRILAVSHSRSVLFTELSKIIGMSFSLFQNGFSIETMDSMKDVNIMHINSVRQPWSPTCLPSPKAHYSPLCNSRLCESHVNGPWPWVCTIHTLFLLLMMSMFESLRRGGEVTRRHSASVCGAFSCQCTRAHTHTHTFPVWIVKSYEETHQSCI